MTLREALDHAIPRLQSAGVESPRLDAELLLAHALSRSRTHLYTHPTQTLEPDQETAFQALLQRRAAREPLPYLLGEWEWMGLQLRVTPAVLIPRPETETLVEEAARRLAPDARILDVGAGSGCISIGLTKLLPGARITAVEPSAPAREVATENSRRHQLQDRITLVPGAWPAVAAALGPFEAVVSNPPYIPTLDVDQLEPELRLHEPRLALDGGADGLDVIRALVEIAPTVLTPGGLLAMEVATDQAPSVLDLLARCGFWSEVETIRDLAGGERVVLARSGR